MSVLKYRVSSRGLSFLVKVVPGAAQSEFRGVENDHLKIRLAATPVDGRANEELIRFLSQALGISKSQVSIQHGHSSRRKLLQLEHFGEEAFCRFLEKLVE